MQNKNKIGIFTFFTGAGFLDLGFEHNGFTSLLGNEISDEFCQVYEYSRKKMHVPLPKYGLQKFSIDCFLEKQEEKVFLFNSISDAQKDFDFIGFIGGPPCPDFSVAGKNKGSTGNHGRLSQSYIDLICEHKPDFFVFENVKGLWRTSTHRAFFDKLVEQLRKAGYATTARLINALEYGAPQDRERIILIGIKQELMPQNKKKNFAIDDFPWDNYILYSKEQLAKISWPKTNKFIENSQTVCPADVIEKLTVEYWFQQNKVENHANADDFFIPRAGLVKMQTYDEGDDSKKCYKRLHRWRYSPTAAYGNNEVHLHPYKARRISAAEALAIQSLPKDFELPKDISLTSMFKTIGNGVPYLAAAGVAKTLYFYLSKRCTLEK